LRSSRKTSSAVENVRVYAVEEAAVRPLTGFLEMEQRYPRLTISSRASSASCHEVVRNCTAPPPVTVPSVSSNPARSDRRCISDARR
jgi:hypothetical protein